MCSTYTALSRLSVIGCVYVITFKALLGHGQDFFDFSLCINIRSTNDIQMWKNIVCCFTMLHVNGLMQIVLFDNNSFSLFAFVLLLTLRYKHSFVCKGCYFIPQEIHLQQCYCMLLCNRGLTVYQFIDADQSNIHLVTTARKQ